MMKKGIDVSYCQKGIDFEAAKRQGAEFVIIRAGISTRTDTEFKNHVEGATAAGLPYGFYWYSKALSVAAAKQEAAACIAAIKPYCPTYPVFYDMEEQEQINKLSTDLRTAIVTTFCDEVAKAGYIAGVYANPSWLECYLDKSKIVGKYDIWLAHWTNDPDKPSKYDYGQNVWQWGICKVGKLDVDGDICYCDYKRTSEVADCNKIYRSLGVAAKRKGASNSATQAGRCERGAYYLASQIVNASDGRKWFRHLGTDLYSAVTDYDGSVLFEEFGTYSNGK